MSHLRVRSYVFPARNHVARFLPRLGRDVADRLYTLNRMIGPLEELLDWDMGLGVDHLDFIDVVIPEGAPDPVNFDVALGIADQVNGLTLGQQTVQVPMAPPANGMHDNGAPAAENRGMLAAGQFMEGNGVEAVGQQAEVLQTTLVENGLLFAGDPSIEDVD
ncbi:hypothetical protein ACET3Z_021078 [Daucus carota]